MCCVPFVVCVDVVVLTYVSSLPLHGVERFVFLETCKPFGSGLSSLRCESFTHIWLGIEVKVAAKFCSTIKAFRLRFFPLLWLLLIMASGFSVLWALPLIQFILGWCSHRGVVKKCLIMLAKRVQNGHSHAS